MHNARNSSGGDELKGLIDLFWQRHGELKSAATHNDFARMDALDRELDPLLEHITNRRTGSKDEILEQFRFSIDLLNEEAEDTGCVQRNSDMLRRLVERYIGWVPEQGEVMDGRNLYQILDEHRLDELDDRIVVVSPGYRISYTNAANAACYALSTQDIVGQHVAEFVGLQHFSLALKTKLDRCFKGEQSKHTYARQEKERTIVCSLTLSPCYSPSYKLVGALMVVHERDDRRNREMS